MWVRPPSRFDDGDFLLLYSLVALLVLLHEGVLTVQDSFTGLYKAQ